MNGLASVAELGREAQLAILEAVIDGPLGVNDVDVPDTHGGVVAELPRHPPEPVLGRKDLEHGEWGPGRDLLNRLVATQDGDIGHAEACRRGPNAEFRPRAQVPFFRVHAEPGQYGLLPARVVVLAHGALLDLAVHVVGIRLELRAQVIIYGHSAGMGCGYGCGVHRGPLARSIAGAPRR